jgi:hypothetical protein
MSAKSDTGRGSIEDPRFCFPILQNDRHVRNYSGHGAEHRSRVRSLVPESLDKGRVRLHAWMEGYRQGPVYQKGSGLK